MLGGACSADASHAPLFSLPVDDQNAVMGTFVCILDVGCAALNAIRDRKIRRAARENESKSETKRRSC